MSERPQGGEVKGKWKEGKVMKKYVENSQKTLDLLQLVENIKVQGLLFLFFYFGFTLDGRN